MKLTATFTAPTVTVQIASPAMDTSVGNPIARDLVERDPYTGEYSVTPSAEPQTLLTDGLRMTDNITINPIPSIYGLITTDGSIITVS